jgi:hypothetical protein
VLTKFCLPSFHFAHTGFAKEDSWIFQEGRAEMPKFFPTAVAVILLSLIANGSGTAFAQTTIVEDAATTEAMRQAIIKKTGAQAETVAVAASRNVVTISRVNSNINNSTHQGFNDEASAIASIVLQEISNKAQYQKVHTIRVQYVKRSDTKSKIKTIDSVEFRKNAKGVFELHST